MPYVTTRLRINFDRKKSNKNKVPSAGHWSLGVEAMDRRSHSHGNYVSSLLLATQPPSICLQDVKDLQEGTTERDMDTDSDPQSISAVLALQRNHEVKP